jgi:hypothetical protein
MSLCQQETNAAALADLRADPERAARMGLAARLRAEREFAFGVLHEETLRWLDGRAAQPPEPPAGRCRAERGFM